MASVTDKAALKKAGLTDQQVADLEAKCTSGSTTINWTALVTFLAALASGTETVAGFLAIFGM